MPSFSSFRDVKLWESFIKNKLAPYEENVSDYLKYWFTESRDSTDAYPSQGMLLTPFDYLEYVQKGVLPPQRMVEILRVRQYFLEIFNHPERIKELKKVDKADFVPPPLVKNSVMDRLISEEVAASVSDLGIAVVGSQQARVARSKRFKAGPFVKLGKRARSLLVGSAMPDVFGSVSSISTMAQCLSLVCVPRNGPFSEIKRQVDLVKEVWHALQKSEVLAEKSVTERKFLLNHWQGNVMGTLEADPTKAIARSRALYKAGVKVFRVYSPEPGTGTLKTVKRLRKEWSNELEIFAGQVVDVRQARQLEEAGADALYVGIGGGGRCITGVRSGSVIDWPILLWKMRGEVSIPIVVEGGASDHIATTLALGASGIGVSRSVAGGTIESPGGMLYCIDKQGNYFKPYGGEASARTKYLDKKMLPFDLPSFVEGEVSRADMAHLSYGEPTIPYNTFNLIEDVILSYVFRGVGSLEELHQINPSPIRIKSMEGSSVQETH